MISKILLGIVATLAFLGIGLYAIFSMQPSEFVVERSVVIEASPEVIFAHVDDFRAWQQWAPWAGPDVEVTFSGADHGEGAVFEWAGDGEIGSGRLTITESDPGRSVQMDHELLSPVRSWHTTEFTFEPVDGGTRVIWSIRSETSMPMKAFMSFGGLEEMIGQDYENALAQLVTIVEEAEGR